MACVKLPYAKRRVQNNSEGFLGFCHIVCLEVSTASEECCGLIPQAKGKDESEKNPFIH